MTIVIPTYNRREYLKKALESIAGQTCEHSEFEVLIIDDFSTDGTEDMVKEFSKEADFRISYFKNNKKGQTIARNKGFKLAKGAIVVSTDSDTEADPDWLKGGLGCFKDEAVSAVEGRIIARGKPEPFYHTLYNEEGGAYQTANMLYRREILERVGYLDETLNQWGNFGSDYDLALRVIEGGGKIVFAKDAIVYHPVYKIGTKDILKNSLKSGAIPYLYKKHKSRLPHHLKMSFDRALGGIFLFVFLISAFFNYPIMLISLIGIFSSTAPCIQRFKSAALSLKLKALLVYSAGSGINLFAFLRGCWRFRVLPTKRIFRL